MKDIWFVFTHEECGKKIVNIYNNLIQVGVNVVNLEYRTLLETFPHFNSNNKRETDVQQHISAASL